MDGARESEEGGSERRREGEEPGISVGGREIGRGNFKGCTLKRTLVTIQ